MAGNADDGSEIAAAPSTPASTTQPTTTADDRPSEIASPAVATTPLAIYEPPDRGLLYGVIVVVSLVASALAGYLWWQASERADIAYDGNEIVNADAILADAESLYLHVMETDGAVLTGDERCVFGGREERPQVLCGPGWLGLSLPEQPWLEMAVEFDVTNDKATGTLTGAWGPTEAEMRTFNRPDGRKAVSPGEPIYSTLGPRTGNGWLITDPGSVVAAADAAFAEAMSVPNPLVLSIAADARCYLVESLGDRGQTVINGQALCGPMRTSDSLAEAVWTPVRLQWIEGETFGNAIVDFADAPSLSADETPWLVALAEGSTLSRPDGLDVVSAATVDRPPRRPDFIGVFPASIDEPRDGYGRLITETETITFSGFGRTDRIGTGPDAVIAAPGHELVIARHRGGNGGVFQPRGLVLVNGAEIALPQNWWISDEAQVLVVSVPTGSTGVSLQIENDGRPQTISLEDGKLESGFPLALYREPVELNDAVATRVDMPVGEAVIIDGVVIGLEWSAKTLDEAWLPVGQSRLDLEFQTFLFDYPCCETSGFEVVTSVALIDPASGEPLPDARPDPETGPPSFLVDEAIEAVTVQFDFVVDFEVDGQAEQESAQIELEVELP